MEFSILVINSSMVGNVASIEVTCKPLFRGPKSTCLQKSVIFTGLYHINFSNLTYGTFLKSLLQDCGLLDESRN